MAYLFSSLEAQGEPQAFGAVVEEVIVGGSPGGKLRAVLTFWADLAEVCATPGARFDLWLGRTVGHGEVVEIVGGTNGE